MYLELCPGQPTEHPKPEDDPLPNEDHSLSENNSNNGQSHNDLVTIHVTNELGETKEHLKNGFVISAKNLIELIEEIVFLREKTDACDDQDITDMHHHLGGHHKVIVNKMIILFTNSFR